MKLLLIADQEEPYLWDYYQPGRLSGYDMILSAGDLKPAYLRFLVTMANRPLLYVHGNHDVRYETDVPEGCDCIDGAFTVCKGLRILGLGGSYRYRNGTYMYTEQQMRKRIRRLRFRLWRKKGFDILVTHAPARGINDFDTLSHRGFACFTELLDRYQPRLFVHGHIHRNYGADIPRFTQRGETQIVNACEYAVVEI